MFNIVFEAGVCHSTGCWVSMQIKNNKYQIFVCFLIINTHASSYEFPKNAGGWDGGHHALRIR